MAQNSLDVLSHATSHPQLVWLLMELDARSWYIQTDCRILQSHDYVTDIVNG